MTDQIRADGLRSRVIRASQRTRNDEQTDQISLLSHMTVFVKIAEFPEIEIQFICLSKRGIRATGGERIIDFKMNDRCRMALIVACGQSRCIYFVDSRRGMRLPSRSRFKGYGLLRAHVRPTALSSFYERLIERRTVRERDEYWTSKSNRWID